MANQTHCVPVPLSALGPTGEAYGVNSTARWAINPTNNAIVFVHGFAGHAMKTWTDFDMMLPSYPTCSGHDLVFFGYRSIAAQAMTRGLEFFNFLNLLMEQPTQLINSSIHPSARRAQDFEYQSVRIVAHSLGAVVTRLALLEAYRQQKQWITRVEMDFFAPAHTGARLVDFANSFLGAFSLTSVMSLIQFSSQSSADLAPDSRIMKYLQDETQRIWNEYQQAQREGRPCLDPTNVVKARKVIIAENERIVSNAPFFQDPTPILYKAKDHTSVCKPNSRFTDPVVDILT